jgi:ribose 5-phosphate isomerase B
MNMTHSMITLIFVFRAQRQLLKIQNHLESILGGSGNGEQMAANKVKGVRAALVWSIETAKLAREHNNANVIAVGGVCTKQIL